MSRLTMLQKNGITNMVCKNEDCHTPEISCLCTIIEQCECPTLKEVIETLAHYKDLEEQGRLIELPCKVGDTVYFPIHDRYNEAVIEAIGIEKDGIRAYWVQYDVGVDVTELWDEGCFEISELGKTVFLTKEEAEAKLAELKGE